MTSRSAGGSNISFGIIFACNRYGIVGVFPVILSLFFILGAAVSRRSGYRHILPVDWVGYLYFFAGIIEILRVYINLFRTEKFPANWGGSGFEKYKDSNKKFLTRKAWLWSLVYFMFSALVIFSMRVIPPRLPEISNEQMGEFIIQSVPDTISKERMQKLLNVENMVVEIGTALYPRAVNAKFSQAPVDPFYSPYLYDGAEYLGFHFINQDNKGVKFEFEQQEDAPRFPNGSQVVVFGCLKFEDEKPYKDYIDAIVIGLLSQDHQVTQIYYRVSINDYECLN